MKSLRRVLIACLMLSFITVLQAEEKTIALVCQPESGTMVTGEIIDMRNSLPWAIEVLYFGEPDFDGTPATITQTGDINVAFIGRIDTRQIAGSTSEVELITGSNSDIEATLSVNRLTGRFTEEHVSKSKNTKVTILGSCSSAERKF
jgi:hypothetical protein